MRKRAFTLIELMVVILVLSILAAVIMPRVVGRSMEAKRSKAVADMATLRSLVQQFRMDTDRLPTQAEGLDALVTAPNGIKHWQGPYIGRIPLDPWGNAYAYNVEVDSQARNFRISSYGADGQIGGQGDAEDIVDDGNQ